MVRCYFYCVIASHNSVTAFVELKSTVSRNIDFNDFPPIDTGTVALRTKTINRSDTILIRRPSLIDKSHYRM